MSVPFLDLRRGYHGIRDEILLAVERTLESGWYVLGQEVAAFEREFADYCGTRHAVGVGSGTDALHLALRACGVKPGDGVVTAPNTAVPTVSAIVAAQACPVFVDIDPRTMTLDPERLQARLSTPAAGPRVTAVIPVHLYGGPADMDPILDVAREHGLMVIEDAAQAHGVEYRGRRAGSLGQAGCFSFYPTKNLGACGDAGMVVTNDADVAERLRMLRNYGEEAKYRSRTDGFNSRLDELQAAILRVKLRHLEEWIAERRRWARLYGELLADAPVTLPAEPPSCTTRHPCTCSPRMSRSAPTKAASPRPSARARRSVAAALSRALRSRGTAHRRGRPLGAVRPATTGRLAISEARAHPGPWARRLATNGSVSTSESFSS